jgi:carbon storage regulator
MLVLSRKVGESVVIGNGITVTVVRISGGGVRIGVEAPADCPVMRQELTDPDETEPRLRRVAHPK